MSKPEIDDSFLTKIGFETDKIWLSYSKHSNGIRLKNEDKKIIRFNSLAELPIGKVFFTENQNYVMRVSETELKLKSPSEDLMESISLRMIKSLQDETQKTDSEGHNNDSTTNLNNEMFERMKNFQKELFWVEYFGDDTELFDNLEDLQITEEEFLKLEEEVKKEGVIVSTWDEKMELSKIRKAQVNQQRVNSMMKQYIDHYSTLESQIQNRHSERRKNSDPKLNIAPLLNSVDIDSTFEKETRRSNFIQYILRGAHLNPRDLRHLALKDMNEYYNKYKNLGNQQNSLLNTMKKHVDEGELESAPWNQKITGIETLLRDSSKELPLPSYKNEVEKVHDVPEDYFSVE